MTSFQLPLLGRRRPDRDMQEDGSLVFEEDEPGDYWKYPNSVSSEPTNLTGTVWGVCIPGGPVGLLTKHTVREHDDGTISVLPGDGCSNSIPGPHFHGYIRRGVWDS